MVTPTAFRHYLSMRMQQVRIDRYGDGEDGIAGIAEALMIPQRTWENYESGVSMPSDILLKLINLTSVEPYWLLTGEGEQYSRGGWYKKMFGPDL